MTNYEILSYKMGKFEEQKASFADRILSMFSRLDDKQHMLIGKKDIEELCLGTEYTYTKYFREYGYICIKHLHDVPPRYNITAPVEQLEDYIGLVLKKLPEKYFYIIEIKPTGHKYNLVKAAIHNGKIIYLYYDEDANRNETMGYRVYQIQKNDYDNCNNRIDDTFKYIGYISKCTTSEEKNVETLLNAAII